MWRTRPLPPPPDLEEVKKKSRILVIDDHPFPFQRLFTRDGYQLDRWPSVKNLPQLTDGHFDLVLLDLHGVGLAESSDLQGLGILKSIKDSNPAQIVLAYSSQPQSLSRHALLDLADHVLDKAATYIEYKSIVDKELMRRASPAYYVAVVNRVLGEDVAGMPKLVPKTLQAFRKGSVDNLCSYLRANLTDSDTVDRIIAIVSLGISAIGLIR